jgi:hypothetical protein
MNPGIDMIPAEGPSLVTGGVKVPSDIAWKATLSFLFVGF